MLLAGPVKSSLGTHQLVPDVSLAGRGRVSIRQLATAKLAPRSRQAQKVPKLRPCAHGEATDHAGVHDELVRTCCAARNRFRPPRRATLHLMMGPLRCTVSVLLLWEWLLQQCPIAVMPRHVAAKWRQHDCCGRGVPLVPSGASLFLARPLVSMVGMLEVGPLVAFCCQGR